MASASSMEIAVAIVVEIAAWMLMVVAMMFPLVIGSVRTVAARSLWRRRHRAIAGFLTGYAGAWFLVGLVASMLIALVHTSADGVHQPRRVGRTHDAARASAAHGRPARERRAGVRDRRASLTSRDDLIDPTSLDVSWMLASI